MQEGGPSFGIREERLTAAEERLHCFQATKDSERYMGLCRTTRRSRILLDQFLCGLGFSERRICRRQSRPLATMLTVSEVTQQTFNGRPRTPRCRRSDCFQRAKDARGQQQPSFKARICSLRFVLGRSKRRSVSVSGKEKWFGIDSYFHFGTYLQPPAYLLP
jgi:hypothetical protein